LNDDLVAVVSEGGEEKTVYCGEELVVEEQEGYLCKAE